MTQSPPLGVPYVLGRQNLSYPGAMEPLQYLRLLLPLHLPRMSTSGSPRYSDVSSPADLASKALPCSPSGPPQAGWCPKEEGDIVADLSLPSLRGSCPQPACPAAWAWGFVSSWLVLRGALLAGRSKLGLCPGLQRLSSCPHPVSKPQGEFLLASGRSGHGLPGDPLGNA